jgi:hypothetical protein
MLEVSERRPRSWGARAAHDKATVPSEHRRKKTKRLSPKPAAERFQPEGWHRRLRTQTQNLARAIEMLEQAVAMMSEPRDSTLARAECLRGAGLITLLAASELLVVAGWFEADQAVQAGTLEGSETE